MHVQTSSKQHRVGLSAVDLLYVIGGHHEPPQPNLMHPHMHQGVSAAPPPPPSPHIIPLNAAPFPPFFPLLQTGNKSRLTPDLVSNVWP